MRSTNRWNSGAASCGPAADSGWNCTLNAGASATVTITATVQGPDAFDLTAAATTDSGDTDLTNNSATVHLAATTTTLTSSPNPAALGQAITFTAHVTPAGTMVPVFFFDHEVPRIPRTSGRRRFCVQGYFDPTRRDYAGLLRALQALRAEGHEDFEV